MQQKIIPLLLAGALLSQGCQPAAQQQNLKAEPNTPPVTTSHCIELIKGGGPSSMLLGYGSGSSLADAKQQAYADIASQIEVGVVSRGDSLNIKRGTTISQQYQSRITTFAEAQLDDLSMECLDKPGDGRTHVVLGYDLRPLGLRLKDRLVEHIGYQPARLNLSGPTALTGSELSEQLVHGFSASGVGRAYEAALSLHRRNKRWQLGIGNFYTSLNDSQLNQAVAWQRLQRGGSELVAVSPGGRTLPGIIADETEFRLRVTSADNGYLQIVGIYENGDVDILRNDIQTAYGMTHTFPRGEGVFEAGLFDRNKQAVDVYLALITAEVLSQTGLPLLGSNLDGENRNLEKLITELERRRTPVAVLPVTITPR